MPDMNALRNSCQPEHEADSLLPVEVRGVSDNADASVAEAEAAWAGLTDLPRSFDDLGRHAGGDPGPHWRLEKTRA
jgi:hypothetical protein